jgi:signal peptide peptidase SppA
MIPLISGKPFAMSPENIKSFLTQPEGISQDTQSPIDNTPTGSVGIIRIRGALSHGDPFASYFGGTDIEDISAALDLFMGDDSISSIVLDIDSPGGDVNGTASLAEKIFNAKKKKPICSYVSGTAASAAYWIASASDKIIGNPAAIVGSIGVYATIIDQSKLTDAMGIDIYTIVSNQSPNKVPDPSSNEGYAQLQKEVDALANVFIESVAKYRNTDVQTVRTKYGKGDVLIGKAAKAAGMIDMVGSLEDAIGKKEKQEDDKQETKPIRRVGLDKTKARARIATAMLAARKMGGKA